MHLCKHKISNVTLHFIGMPRLVSCENNYFHRKTWEFNMRNIA